MIFGEGAAPDVVYKRIGEYVVSFQWMENKLREIGWLIQDPNRTERPPRSLRDETTKTLIDRVVHLYVDLVQSLDIDDAASRVSEFKELGRRCHEIRQQRNRLMHSAFVELKAGGEVHGILRSDPRLSQDPETGEPLFDNEILTSNRFDDLIGSIAEVGWPLNVYYMQLIHWAPFDHLRSTGAGDGQQG